MFYAILVADDGVTVAGPFLHPKNAEVWVRDHNPSDDPRWNIIGPIEGEIRVSHKRFV